MKPLQQFVLCLKISIFQVGLLLAQNPTEPFSPHLPGCAFDEMNHNHSPEVRQQIKDYLLDAVPHLSAQDRNMAEPLLSVAVVVHVIHDGEPIGVGRNISTEQVLAQIDLLNEDYNALNSQFYDTPNGWINLAGMPNIQFCLATEDPDGNPTNGIDRVEMEVTGSSWNNNNINSVIKPAVNWDPLKYINIYVVSIPGTNAAGGVVGYSNYPVPGLIGAASDGPVIDYNWFGAPGFPVSGYRAITHELGHYLGLPHTFNGSSCNTDDNIADTPEIEESTRAYLPGLECSDGYPMGPVSCGNEHLYVNYMDYVNENCYTSFTQGQVNVMRSVLDGTSNQFNYGSRHDLLNYAPLLCDLPDHDAGVVRLISPDEIYCTADSLNPIVTLRNFGQENLTEVDIIYQINGGPLTEFDWQGNLMPGENAEVTLPNFLPPDGAYLMEVFTTSPNGQNDERIANDTLTTVHFAYVALRPTVVENFELGIALPSSLGFFEFNPDGDDLFWEMTDEASAFGEGEQSILIDNLAASGNPNTSGTFDALITRHFDLSEMENSELRFDMAYAPQSSTQSDTLLVLIATECSQNFNQLVFAKSGNQLATAPATSQAFTPSPSQWRTEIVDLSGYDGNEDVTVALVNISGGGNRLFLDNIRIGRSCNSLSVNWELTPNGCGSSCNGEASVTISGDNGNLNYQWEAWPVSHNVPMIYDLCPGEVSVTITDALGCEIIASNEITQSPDPEGNTSSTLVTSFGADDGTATVTLNAGSPPFAFLWSNGINANSNGFSNTISDLAPGDYSVTVTDVIGCSSVFEIEVQSVCTSFAVATSVTHVSCFGAMDGEILVQPINGVFPFEFTWSNGGFSPFNNNLTAGTYSVTITDGNNCPAENTIVVEQPEELILMASSTNETSIGANDGTVSVVAEGGSPGYEYLWSNGSTQSSQMNLMPGEYAVIVTDLDGCQGTATVTILPFNCDNFTATISSTNLNCFGDVDGNAQVQTTGGQEPVTYLWSNGETTPNISNLPAGDYGLTVSDAAGCGAELEVSISSPAELIANLSSSDETSPNADDGTASVMPSGGISNPSVGYSVMWSNGETTFSIENLEPGFYYVTVTDANECEALDTAFIQSANCNLSIETSATSASCPDSADGLALVTNVPGGTSPLTYIWSNGDMDPFAENLLPGDYTVTVSDANGCSISASVTIQSNDTEPPVLLLQDLTLEIGVNGNATLSPEDVDVGSSDNCSVLSLELSQSEFDCSDVGEVEVEVTGTDENGNASTDVITVTVVELIEPDIICPTSYTVEECETVFYDSPVVADNCGSVDFEILEGLESGEVFPFGTTIITYQATDFNDNISSCSFEVTLDDQISLSVIGSAPSCTGFSDGHIDLTISGGEPPYQITWSNGTGTDLPAGEYGVTVSDNNGCSAEQSITLEDPPLFTAEVVNVTPAVDINTPGIISLNINGGVTPWILTWLENGVELPNFDPLAAPPGNYTLMITDQNGCEILIDNILVDNLNSAVEFDNTGFIELFPNPSNGLIWLKSSHDHLSKGQVTLYDVQGRVINTRSIALPKNQPVSLDLSMAGQGVFWMKMQFDKLVKWEKLVIF